MLRIMICDDDSNFVQLISEKVTRCLSEQDVEYFCWKSSNPNECLRHCKQEIPDIILLDIDMPSFSGFEIANKIPRRDDKPLLLFVSSQDHLVFDSFIYEPFRFVRKSCLEDLDRALKDALEKIWQKSGRYVLSLLDGQEINVLLDQVIYFESDARITTAIFHQGTEKLRTPFKELENDLKERGFFRIYQNILVNMKYVYSIQYLSVTLHYNGKEKRLPVGRTRKEELQKLFLSQTRN